MKKNQLLLVAVAAVFLTACGNKPTDQGLSYEDSVAVNDSLEATADQLMEEMDAASTEVDNLVNEINK